MLKFTDPYRRKDRRQAKKLARQRAWRAFAHGRQEYGLETEWTPEALDRLLVMIREGEK